MRDLLFGVKMFIRVASCISRVIAFLLGLARVPCCDEHTSVTNRTFQDEIFMWGIRAYEVKPWEKDPRHKGVYQSCRISINAVCRRDGSDLEHRV